MPARKKPAETDRVDGIRDSIRDLAEPIDTLEPWPGNPRRHAHERITESLRVNGQYKPITVRRGDRRILAGHGTVDAARALGWSHVAVTFVDCDDQTALRIIAVDNKTNDDASYDDAELAALLAAITDPAGTGFTADEIDRVIAAALPRPALTDPDAAPPKPPKPATKPGDVWELGPHRLLCGDAGDERAARRMLDGDRPVCMWTDPPYGVSYVGRTDEKLTIANDGADGLPALLDAAFGAAAALLAAGAAVYVAHADTARVVFEQAMLGAGWTVRQNLIWVKSQMVLGRSDYHWQHEPILAATVPDDDLEPGHEPVLYGFAAGGEGRLGRGGPSWHGDNRQTTVFQVPKPPRNADHPTMKPVALIAAMLANSCPPGGVVLDPFAGSGSTLIACHGLGMRARLVELDPGYCDVVCRRWQEHTGIVATRGGKPHDFTTGG